MRKRPLTGSRWRLNKGLLLKANTIKASDIIPLEDDEAIALWDWAQLHPIFQRYLSHIPNEAKRSWMDGKRQKAKGVRAGISDYFLAYPVGNYHGYWGELKRADTRIKPKDNQSEWLDRMASVGYKTDLWYGAKDAQDKLLAYLPVG